ncbi:MAG: hypothetical protein ABI968_06975 [Acidobacteriota bacterium]
MKTSIAWIFAAIGGMAGGNVLAGDLVIGHVAVHLGMPEKEALAALSKEFAPEQVSVSEGKYNLRAREHGTYDPSFAGSVSFRDGKLYRASKFWGGGGLKDKSSEEGLYGVLADLAGKDGRTCRIKAETLRSGAKVNGQDVKEVTIDFPPDRKVTLRIWQPSVGGQEQPLTFFPSVDEFLMDVAAPK